MELRAETAAREAATEENLLKNRTVTAGREEHHLAETEDSRRRSRIQTTEYR